MSGTMTYVGFDVHARSAHAAAIDVMTGELSRVRFGSAIQTPVDWLKTLGGPVRACYEAGPTAYVTRGKPIFGTVAIRSTVGGNTLKVCDQEQVNGSPAART